MTDGSEDVDWLKWSLHALKKVYLELTEIVQWVTVTVVRRLLHI